MTLAVLGAGFGRTGTLSLKAALETLGFVPCHHMVVVAQHPQQARVWVSAARAEPTDWHALLGGYAAAVDWPATAFWRELLDAFPSARVILTVRDGAAWYASFRETIVERTSGLAPPPDSPLYPIYDLTRKLILDGVFGGRATDEHHARAVYEKHNRSVSDAVPPEQLLIYDVAAGWPPLCSFLERPVPREPFPRLNLRSSFLREYFGGPGHRRTSPG